MGNRCRLIAYIKSKTTGLYYGSSSTSGGYWTSDFQLAKIYNHPKYAKAALKTGSTLSYTDDDIEVITEELYD